MELFSLICNIFLYSLAFVLYGVCERHPEGKNTASPCRNFFHAMRLERCKEFFLVAAVKSVIFCQNSTNFVF